MGVRVELKESESIVKAMQRLRKLQYYHIGWKDLRQPNRFVPLTEIRRKKARRKLILSWIRSGITPSILN
jgi:hypothetical protein